jgi:hypothetical protein
MKIMNTPNKSLKPTPEVSSASVSYVSITVGVVLGGGAA